MKRARLAAYIQHLLGPISMDTFADRKRFQKLVYILQAFGADLGYSFGWYIHGPYSPELADDGFQLASHPDEPAALTDDELRLIEAVKSFLGDDLYDPETLELLASIVFLAKEAYMQGRSREDVWQAIKTHKPQFERELFDTCWERTKPLRDDT